VHRLRYRRTAHQLGLASELALGQTLILKHGIRVGLMDDCDLIKLKITNALNDAQVQVTNNSHLHAGHAGSPNSGRSHFKVEITSTELSLLPRVRAHQKVYEILKVDMRSYIHALEIVLLRA